MHCVLADDGSVADTLLPWHSSHGPQAPFCHLGSQIANCPSGEWLIGQVATGRSCTQFVPATARGDAQAERSLWQVSLVPAPPRDKLARRHELATHVRRDSTPITDPPVRRQKTLAARAPADKIRDGGARSDCSQQPLATPHTRQLTHRERARPSWFRRLIAPLIRLTRMAKIM